MYFTMRTRCDSFDDTSYESKRKGQEGTTVHRYRLNGGVPGQTDLISFDIDPARVIGMPTTDQMDTWELEEQWLVVTCEKMQVKRGTTEDGREYTLTSFVVSELHPMSAEEHKQLQAARKKTKADRKAQRAADKAAKSADKDKGKKAA